MIVFTILGTILKILGIVLLSVLCLLLLLLLLFLVVPVRYRARVLREGENTELDAKISYAGLFRVLISHKDAETAFSVKLLWFSLHPSDRKTQKKRQGSLQDTSKEAAPEQVMSSGPEMPEGQELKPDMEEAQTTGQETAVVQNPTQPEKKGEPDGTAQEKDEPDDTAQEQEAEQTGEETNAGVWEKIRRILQKICDIIQKLFHLPERIMEKLSGLQTKTELVRAFLHEEKNKNAINVFRNTIFRLLKYLLPYKIKGELVVGTGDPYSMGQLLSILGMLYPLYASKLRLTADFETEKLRIEGSVRLVGRVRPGRLLYELLRLWIKGRGFTIIRNIKKLKKNLVQAKS